MKEHLLISIDGSVLLSFRQQVKPRDRSRTVENMIRAFVLTSETTREEQVVLDEIDKINLSLEELRQKQAALGVEYANLQRDREEQKRKVNEMSLMMRNTNRANPLADEIGTDNE